jgi:hypothetical protein
VVAAGFMTGSPAQAAIVDSPGTLQNSSIWNPFLSKYDIYAGTWVEYQVDEAGTFPRVGDTFYVSTVVAAFYANSAPVMGVALHEKLVADGGPAVSAAYPVRCYLKTSFDDPTWDEVPESCSQTPLPNANGGLTYGTRVLNSGESFKVSVPMKFTKPKNGFTDGDAARVFSVVNDLNQTPDPLLADQYIFVFPAAGGAGNPGGSGTPPTPNGLAVGGVVTLPKKQSFGKARYSSKTPRVCKVTKKGKVTARKAGKCKVLAKATKGSKKKIITITVR